MPVNEPVAAKYLTRYRVFAFATAALLIILVFVGVPLQIVDNNPAVVNDVGTVHGLLYIVYLFSAFSLTRRLGVPKWQMLLVLLAGTVPFAAFVAERKMTRRFKAANHRPGDGQGALRDSPEAPGPAIRRRWLSRRAVVLHVEVLILAPGCAVAGWWQATRALAGNGLSWFYSIEWPVFAAIAIWGWWYLIHEDPQAYAARRWFRREPGLSVDALGAGNAAPLTVDGSTASIARVLLVAVLLDAAAGIAAVVLLPYHRASEWLPSEQRGIYVAHASLSLAVLAGGVLLLARTWRSSRVSRLTGWIGMSGITVAALGGLVTVSHSFRLAGMALMLIGTIVAAFGYALPSFEKLPG